VIEDESEEPSRAGTPAIGDEKAVMMGEGNAPAESGALVESKEKPAEKPVEAPPKVPELPPDVRAKLRKLEKMESKYQGRAICIPACVHFTDCWRPSKILSNCACTSCINRTI
jgi:hypothetical protein